MPNVNEINTSRAFIISKYPNAFPSEVLAAALDRLMVIQKESQAEFDILISKNIESESKNYHEKMLNDSIKAGATIDSTLHQRNVRASNMLADNTIRR